MAQTGNNRESKEGQQDAAQRDYEKKFHNPAENKGQKSSGDDVRKQEADSTSSGGISGSSGSTLDKQERTPWENRVGLDSNTSKAAGIFASLKQSAGGGRKKWFIGGGILGATLLGGGTLFWGFLNLALINIKEVSFEFTHKRGFTLFSHRAAENYKRTFFADTSSCKTPLCRYKYGRGLSAQQVGQLERMGFEGVIEELKDRNGNNRGRYAISSMRPRGGSGPEITQANFDEQFRTNPAFRKLVFRATGASAKFTRNTFSVIKLAKMGIGRGNKFKEVQGGSDEDKKGAHRQFVFGKGQPGQYSEFADEANAFVDNGDADIRKEADELRQKSLSDPNFERPSSRFGKFHDFMRKPRGIANETARAGLTKGGALTLIVDVCNARNLILAGDFIIRHHRMLALAAYAGSVVAFADAMKAGHETEDPDDRVTADQVAYESRQLLTPDSEGRTFFDSPGWQRIAYGVEPNAALISDYSASNSFLAGASGIINMLERAIESPAGAFTLAFLAKNPVSVIRGVDVATLCRYLGSWVANIAAFLVDGLITILTASLYKVVGFILFGIGSYVVMKMIEDYIEEHAVEALAGTINTGDESSYENGTMLASGMGVIASEMSRTMGMRPMTNEEVAQQNDEINRLYNKYYAKNKPSLTEKITTNMAMFSVQTFAGGLDGILKPQKLFAAAGIDQSMASVYAAGQAEPSDVCADPTLEGVATTPYCVPIYGEDFDTLTETPKYEPAAVTEWMVENGYVNEKKEIEALYESEGVDSVERKATIENASEGDSEKIQEYQDYIDVCMDEMMPLTTIDIPDIPTGDEENILKYCTSKKEKYTYFRLYRMDKGAIEPAEALDKDFYDTPIRVEGEGGDVTFGDGDWPVEGGGFIMSCYGDRPQVPDVTGGFHYGVDIGSPPGTPIYAIADGKVVLQETKASGGPIAPGNMTIDHPSINRSIGYLHISSEFKVDVGDQVKKGQQIGTVGELGDIPHLHATYMPLGQKYASKPSDKSFDPAKELEKPKDVPIRSVNPGCEAWK